MQFDHKKMLRSNSKKKIFLFYTLFSFFPLLVNFIIYIYIFQHSTENQKYLLVQLLL